MSSPQEPAGAAGSDQPLEPQVPHEQSPYGTPPPAAPGAQAYPGQQPYAGAPAPYGGQQPPAPSYPGQPGGYPGQYPAAPEGTYGGYPAPGQPYGTQPYGAQPYGAESYPGYPGYGQVYPRNDLGVWSLVLGIAGLFPGFLLLTGIPAIILGRRARQAVVRGEANNDGIAVAGIVTGWIATALGALVAVGIIVAIVFAIASSSSTSY